MSQLTLSVIPGFFDLADSAIAAGQPLTDDSMLKISHRGAFALLGGTSQPSIFGHCVLFGADDGYAYSRGECQFVWMIYSNRSPAAGFIPGQAAPPGQANSQPGTLYNFPGGWNVNDATGLVSLYTTYWQNGNEVVSNDGVIKVYAVCLRLSLNSAN